MSDFMVDINNLRLKLKEAVGKGVFSDDPSLVFEHTILAIVNNAENDRQQLLRKIEQLKLQVATFEGQALALNSFKSLALGTLNGLVSLKDKEIKEQELREQELKENAQENQQLVDLYKTNSANKK